MKKQRVMVNRAIRSIVIAGMSVVVVAQFVSPTRENPSFDPALSIRNYENIPPKILSTLERSCFDCHSNETRWPWYSAVTPLNFLIVDNVNKARKRLNFSEEWVTNEQTRLSSQEVMSYPHPAHGMCCSRRSIVRSSTTRGSESNRGFCMEFRARGTWNSMHIIRLKTARQGSRRSPWNPV